MGEQAGSREYVIYPNEGDTVAYGKDCREVIVFNAESEDEALELAAQRYGIDPATHYAEQVCIASGESFEVAPDAFAFGICTVCPNEDGLRAVAVFDLSDGGAQLLGFLDGEGQVCEGPFTFTADEDMAIVDVTTRRWPYPGDEQYGHMVCGYNFALQIAAS
jgi:hypothetical protein